MLKILEKKEFLAEYNLGRSGLDMYFQSAKYLIDNNYVIDTSIEDLAYSIYVSKITKL